MISSRYLRKTRQLSFWNELEVPLLCQKIEGFVFVRTFFGHPNPDFSSEKLASWISSLWCTFSFSPQPFCYCASQQVLASYARPWEPSLFLSLPQFPSRSIFASLDWESVAAFSVLIFSWVDQSFPISWSHFPILVPLSFAALACVDLPRASTAAWVFVAFSLLLTDAFLATLLHTEAWAIALFALIASASLFIICDPFPLILSETSGVHSAFRQSFV